MGYYSFTAIAQNPVAIESPLVMLDRGFNAFNAVVEDLDAFLQRLKDEGVEVKQVNQLDGLKPVPVESLLLPGEDTSVLTPLLNK
jgi:hypothetical protein